MENVTIPEAVQAVKNHNGLKASQYVYLPGEATEEGKPCLQVYTSKSGRGIVTSYSFGYQKSERGMDCFSCMIMSDYSGRMQHAAKHATAKDITDAHAEAMKLENIQPHIIKACEQHDITV